MASRSCCKGRSTTRITDLPSDIIETHLLTKLDVQSLASLASTCPLLRTMICNKESLWKDICNCTWNSAKHPLVQQTISSFPGGYRSFYSQSLPVLCAKTTRRSLRDQVHTSELISAVDVEYGNNLVYSKVKLTNTDASSFSRSLFCVDMIDHEGSTHVEMPLRYQGDKKACMSKLEHNLTLSWIVIDPTSKRAANVSSLRPVSVRPHRDETSDIKVTYATIISGDCFGTDTAEFVECKVVAILGCEREYNIRLKKLSLCLVDMDKMRVNGKESLRILKESMESDDRRKEIGRGKEIYAKHMNFTRERFIFWVSFAIFMTSSFYLISEICNTG